MTDHLPDIPDASNPFRQMGTARLQDVVAGTLDDGDSVEYRGFHLTGASAGVVVIPDGRLGALTKLDPDDFENVRQLIAYLNALAHRYYEEWTDDQLVEYVGPIGTSDAERAEESDHHVHVPRDEEGR